MKRLLILLIIALSLQTFSQDITSSHIWKEAKDLSQKGFHQQVVDMADSIYQIAVKNDDEINQVASILIKSKELSYFTDGSFKIVEEAIENSDGAVFSILNAYYSSLYLDYYRRHQWEIRNRLETTGPVPEELDFWTHQNFSDIIEAHIEESFKNSDALLLEKTIDWSDIFHSNYGSHTIEPTLYEYILWQAIAFYQSREFSQPEKEEFSLLNDPRLLSNYQEFSKMKFASWENLSYRDKSLVLYQKIIERNKKNDLPRALLYEELQRLDYLRNLVSIENADEIVLKTMEMLFEEFKGQKGSEIIAERLINRYTRHDASEEDYLKADALCQTMIDQDILVKQFQTIKEEIHSKSIGFNMPATIIPQETQLIKLSYKNIDKAYFRIIPCEDFEEFPTQFHHQFSFHKYTKQKAITSFEIDIAKQASLAPLTALFEIPGLDYGSYIILGSSGPDFKDGEDKLAIGVFQVSYIDMVVYKNDHQLMVIDRYSGKPISDAKVTIFKQEWEYSSRKNISRQIGQSKTDKKGFLELDYAESNIKLLFKISKGNDGWTSPMTYMNKKQNERSAKEKTHFFTDRSIYRPGQTVYFKGIITSQKGNEVHIIPNTNKKVQLYGANGKLLNTIPLSSNEYGSIAGSFVLPYEGLTGSMRISDGSGNVSFRVEEYKRPKFKIALEAPKEEVQINDTLIISGQTDYYAGAALQNAKIKYRVSRSVYMPWRWTCWIPMTREIQISAGETVSNEKGKFSIRFPAWANEEEQGINWYQYTIHAEVSDINGETHQEEIFINLGSRSLFIETDLPAIMDKDDSPLVTVLAKTAMHQSIEADMTLLLEKLRSPEQAYREPLWKTDTVLVSEEDIRVKYPQVKAKNKIQDFEVEAVVFTKNLNTKTDSILPRSIFKALDPGAYKMTITCLDKNGKEVKEERYMELFSSELQSLAFPKESFFHLDKSTALVGDTLHFQIGSSHKKQHYFYELRSSDQVFQSKWIKLTNDMDKLSIPITEAHRGGLSLQVFFENNNQVFAFNQQIAVPFHHKALDITLETFRNPMEPGKKESWTVKIKDYVGKPIKTEVLASMYDASLDALNPHSWSYQPYQSTFYAQHWSSLNHRFNCFAGEQGHDYAQFPQIHRLYLWDGSFFEVLRNRDYQRMGTVSPSPSMQYKSDGMAYAAHLEVEEMGGIATDKDHIEKDVSKSETKSISPRKNLEETVFFYPQLTSDDEGNLQLEFTSPEALSSWKLMIMSHTEDVKIGHFSQEISTQKEIMVMPNLPRFLRGGDQIRLSANILNLLEETQQINAQLEILDAITKEPLDIIQNHREQSLQVEAKGQSTVDWDIQVPEKVGAVIIRVMAKGETHSDGEEHLIPVLSQLHFLTDTYPFSLSSKNLLNLEDIHLSKNARKEEDVLTLEITSNPLWYVVQALPNYQRPQKPNALSWMNYYFVHAMASNILEKNPEIEEVFKQWQALSPEELESELFQNPELKSIMVNETPWLLHAESQSQRKKNIARLFNKNNLDYQLETALQKLEELQKPNGGFGWIEGMKSSVYISTQIAHGLGQLIQADILDVSKDYRLKKMMNQLVEYLDTELNIAYGLAQMKKSNHVYSTNILTARAFFLDFKALHQNQPAYDYFLKKWKDQKTQKSLEERMKLAKILWYSGEKEEARQIILSFKDIALKDQYGAIYWKDFERYKSTRKQAEMITLFELMEEDSNWVEGMKLWLLQQKRAHDWGDHKSTAQACYSLLNGANSLSKSPEVYLQVGNEEIKIDGNAGTGYIKITWQGSKIEDALRNLKITKEGEGMIFGAFYDQHFEKMSEINTHEGGVEIEKQVFVAKTIGDKNELISIAEDTQINIGDRVLVRMLIKNQQAMDFVHLRDYLPAGFETQEPLSGYRWQGNISYYQAPGDVATDYYIGHLPKGNFLIEYELNATVSGHLNLGPSEIQSLYAPEFGGHSEGTTIEVK